MLVRLLHQTSPPLFSQRHRVALLSQGERGKTMPVDLASADLPHEPGVYLFKTNQGRVLYVGKATRLNERIRSYFASNPDRHMIPELVARAHAAIQFHAEGRQILPVPGHDQR